MQCEKCHDTKATVFLTQIISGKMYKVDLCEKCAKEMGVLDSSNFSLADLLLNMKNEQEAQAEQDIVCSACGFKESDMNKTGRMGCPQCYKVFSELIEDVLYELHKGSKHTGKIPQDQKKEYEAFKQVQSLRDSLQDAIDNEDYERAAELRDKLNLLNQKSNRHPEKPKTEKKKK
ncbi:MAG: UvrB/UvrC motif-containing protein [Verrucomicrobiota bacterium]